MRQGTLLLRDAIIAQSTPLFETAKSYSVAVVTSVEKDSVGGTIAARVTINGTGEDTVPMRGVSGTEAGDTILISSSTNDPAGPKRYERHIQSANPAPQIETNGSLPDPQFATVPWTSDLITSPGSILANGVVYFNAVEDRWFPEGYTASFKVGAGEWRESGFAPHLGGAQQITLASDFPPDASITVRLRGHYARNANVSVGLDTRVFVTATDNITPGICTGITVDLTIPGAIKITPAGTFDVNHFDHFRYFIATSSGGAGLVTLDGPTGFVWAGAAGNYYVAVAPISHSDVVGTRFPSVAGTYSGPYAITVATPALDTTPPNVWTAPTLSQSTENPPTGGEIHYVTVTLPAYTYPSPNDYDYTLVTFSGTGFAGQERIQYPGTTVTKSVPPVGTISVTLIGVDKLGNPSAASPAATISVVPTGVPAAAPDVTTASGSEAIIVRWTAVARALRFQVWRATSAGGAGAAVIADIDGYLWPDLFSGNGAVGTVYYYKVQAYNIQGSGTISPNWIAGTVGAVDGRNLVALTVTAAALEANLVLASTIRTPNVGYGTIGMYGGLDSMIRAYDNSSVLLMALNGTGMAFYRDGVNPRSYFTGSGIDVYRSTGSSVVSSTFRGDGIRIWNSSGAAARVQLLDSGTYIRNDANTHAIDIFDNGTSGLKFQVTAAAVTGMLLDTTTKLITHALTAAVGWKVIYELNSVVNYFTFQANSTSQLGITPNTTGMTVNFGSAGLLADNLQLQSALGFRTTFANFRHRHASTLGNAAGQQAFFERKEIPVSAGVNVLGFEVTAFRGPNGGASTWWESRIRLQTDIDGFSAAGGYLDLGFRDFNPYWGLGDYTSGVTLYHDRSGVMTGGGIVNVSTVDILTHRNTAVGVLFLGNQSGGYRYLSYDGTYYNLASANLYVNGVLVPSGRVLKEDIADAPKDAGRWRNLRARTFKRKTNQTQDTELGFIAEEVREHFPEVVLDITVGDTHLDQGIQTSGINTMPLIAALLRGVQEFADGVEQRLTKLEATDRR